MTTPRASTGNPPTVPSQPEGLLPTDHRQPQEGKPAEGLGVDSHLPLVLPTVADFRLLPPRVHLKTPRPGPRRVPRRQQVADSRPGLFWLILGKSRCQESYKPLFFLTHIYL